MVMTERSQNPLMRASRPRERGQLPIEELYCCQSLRN